MHFIAGSIHLSRCTKKITLTFLAFLVLVGCQPLANLIKPERTFWTGRNVGPARFSPDGFEIVFSVSEQGGGISHIYKAKVDGTGITQLTTGDSYDHQPVFSPDGTKIVFSSIFGNHQADLFLMNPDGTQKTILTSGPVDDSGPIFSPDGRIIYFIRSEWFGNYSPIARKSWHDTDVFSINIDGTELKRITSKKYYRGRNLSISPDGQTLMAAIWDDESPYFFWMLPIVNPSDKRPVQPNFDKRKSKFSPFRKERINYKEMFDPELSPDGRKMLFTWEGGNERKQLFIMDLDNRNSSELTHMTDSVRDPHFSVDGSQIVFKTVDFSDAGFFKYRAEPTLWIINSDGTGLRAIDFK